jgi:hypothetical protein
VVLFKKMNCGGKKEINIKEKQIRGRKSKKEIENLTK